MAHGAACLKVVSAGLCRRGRKRAIAVPRAGRQPGVGGGPGPVGAIGPATTAKRDAANRVGVIGSAAGKERRSLNRNRARASAQRGKRRLLTCGCALGQAVMSYSRSRPNTAAVVSVAWPAGWLYGACSTGKSTTGNGGGGGGSNFGSGAGQPSTLRRRVFAHFFHHPTSVKFPGPQTEEGAGGLGRTSGPPFPFFVTGP